MDIQKTINGIDVLCHTEESQEWNDCRQHMRNQTIIPLLVLCAVAAKTPNYKEFLPDNVLYSVEFFDPDWPDGTLHNMEKCNT